MRWFTIGLLALAALSPAFAEAADEEQSVAALVRQYEADADVIRKKAELDLRQLRERLIDKLTAKQEELTKAGKLDEAVLIRDQLRALSDGQGPIKVQAYSGSLSGYRNQNGAVLYFEIVGSTSGSCYGTDVYTDDSSLPTAAVHAGALANGESGVVRVTILPGQASYPASTRNGVTSYAWTSQWSASFRVERVRPAVPK